MKITIRVTVLILCAVLLLSACKNKEDTSSVDSIVSNIESGTQSEVTSSNDDSSSESSKTNSTISDSNNLPDFKSLPTVTQNSKYGDLLSQIPAGKSVSLLGDLKEEKYKDAASRLESVLNGYSREISLVAYSLDNTKAISYNAKAELFPACTIKAFYSYFSCLEMDKGKGSLDTVMTYEKKHYEPGTGDMQNYPVGTKFDMKTIITKCMSISDNVGYLMQIDYFGRDSYNNYVTSKGCPSVAIKPTVWALKAKANEHAILWRDIYNYFKSNANHSEFLYYTCTNTAYNFSTSALNGVSYSHKSGFNRDTKWNSMSDAGIVWKGNSPYIVVMLSNAPGINSDAQKVMDKAIEILHSELF